MKVLLTNDDGIQAPGLKLLKKRLEKAADVYVVAPDRQKSSCGHAITLTEPIFYNKGLSRPDEHMHAVSGTPADCVKFALNVLKITPDIVISGINLGPNDGTSVFYSGTVAGAREGCIHAIPSVAVSLNTFKNPDFSAAVLVAEKLMKKISLEGLPEKTFLNVNVPNLKQKEIKGVRYCVQGALPIEEKFLVHRSPDNQEYYWLSGEATTAKQTPQDDNYVLKKGYITIVPVTIDTTAYQNLEVIKKWGRL